MKLTTALKGWLTTNAGVAADAKDDAFNAAWPKAIADGKLDAKTFAELNEEKTVDSLADRVVKAAQAKMNPNAPAGSKATTQTDFLAAGADRADPNIRVHKASEKWSKEKKTALHVKSGQPVFMMGRPVEHPSELEYAKAGVWFRKQASAVPVLRQGMRPFADYEKSLLEEMYAEDTFCYYKNDAHDFPEEVSGLQTKALIDESGGSGGQGLVPIWFDDMIITFPLLYSEVLPYVEIREVPRGSRMVGASLGNPTLSWGTAEGTAFTLFVTTGIAAEIDTTIYPAVIGFEMGIDFLSDAPNDIGKMVQELIGKSALKEWDKVIAGGNGTTQPQGFSNATSFTTVHSVAGSGGVLQVDDAERLIFGLAKQYRVRQFNPRFLMNDTMYQRFRQIPVSASDQRRVFGMDHQSYQLLEYPVSIQNDIANGTIMFPAMMKYRLYRRRGFDMRMVTEGLTLAKTNTVALIGRARFGGKVMDGAGLVKMTDGQNS